MSAQPQATSVTEYRADLGRYAGEKLVIRTKQAIVLPFVFNRAQQIVHAKLSAQMAETGRVRAIILKARQEGISTYVAGRFFRRITMYENQNGLVIADLRKRGQTLFKIYELFDKKLDADMRPSKRWQRKGWTLQYDTTDGMGLNSQLAVETAKDAAAGRGDTIQAVHASELAFWENPEEVWTALMQAVPDYGSEVIVESTANGVGNTFHQMWLDAENGDSSFLAIFLPWWIHEEYALPMTELDRHALESSLTNDEEKMLLVGYPLEGEMHKLTLEQVAWRRATIRDKLRNDENLFHQEYPATAREAFLVSGNCFFDEEALLAYEGDTRQPKRFHITWSRGATLRRPALRGEFRVWKDPTPQGEYVIFVDTATGRMSGDRESIYMGNREQGGRDFSAAWVMEATSLEYVALLHGRIPPEVFAEKCYALGFFYGHPSRRTGNHIPALMGVERNHSSGETIVRLLKDDMNYPNLFFDRQLNHRRNRMTPLAGWVTTEAKRQIMLDEFSGEIRARTLVMPDPETISECFTFIRDESGKPQAQEGCHDDRVIAAAGCVQMARHHYMPGLPSQRTVVRRGGPVGHLESEAEVR